MFMLFLHLSFKYLLNILFLNTHFPLFTLKTQ